MFGLDAYNSDAFRSHDFHRSYIQRIANKYRIDELTRCAEWLVYNRLC